MFASSVYLKLAFLDFGPSVVRDPSAGFVQTSSDPCAEGSVLLFNIHECHDGFGFYFLFGIFIFL